MKYSEVPKYLHNSELYLSLKDNLNEDFDIESEIPPETEEIVKIEDYILLFKIYNRWGLLPSAEFNNYQKENKYEVIKFLINNDDKYDQAKIILNNILNPKYIFKLGRDFFSIIYDNNVILRICSSNLKENIKEPIKYTLENISIKKVL